MKRERRVWEMEHERPVLVFHRLQPQAEVEVDPLHEVVRQARV